MLNRYDAPLMQIQLSDGRTVYKTARPTIVDTSAADTIINVGEQDRFDILAQNVYGNSSQWWIIAAVDGRVNGSLTVPIGTSINIPPVSK